MYSCGYISSYLDSWRVRRTLALVAVMSDIANMALFRLLYQSKLLFLSTKKRYRGCGRELYLDCYINPN